MMHSLKKQFGTVFEEALLNEIAQGGTFRDVPAETELMDIGELIKGVPLVVSGAVKISREDINGDELLLYYLEAGDSCSLTFAWEIGQLKSRIRAVTETPTKLIMIPHSRMELWSERYPTWRKFLLKSYQERMDELLDTLDSVAFDLLESRLWSYLVEKNRITQQNPISITHQNIAHDLYSSRVVISRLLKRLERAGKLELHRHAIELTSPSVT
jgi:CRP/FNR family transcriptional regulator